MTIFSVNDFETPWLLTGGGPSNATENLSVLAYKYTFNRSDVGTSAAIAFVIMLILQFDPGHRLHSLRLSPALKREG